MSPWWLRPTAEGASENGETAGPDETKSGSGAAAKPAPDRPKAVERPDRPKAAKPERPKPAAKPERAKAETPRRSKAAETPGDGGRRRAGSEPGSASPGDRGGGRGGEGRGREARSGRRDERDERGEKGRPEAGRAETGRDERGGREDRSRARGREGFTFDDEISTAEIEAIRREMTSAPERNQSVSDERKIAMFCDLENIALGVRDSQIKKFDVNLVLERLLEKGKIIVKKAYCDWERYSEYKRAFHEAAIEMIDIPQKYYSGKNSADIKMVVDAMDLSYAKEHLDTFVLLSGDSDFSPLVSKLKENNKYVIGIGVKGSSSNLLIDNCDEFIYYEDVWRDRQAAPKVDGGANKKGSEAFTLMVDAIQALLRENKDVLWGSMIKQTMQRKKPSFNEGYYGYSTFSELLEDAERNSLIKLKKDQRSGTYIVTGFSSRR